MPWVDHPGWLDLCKTSDLAIFETRTRFRPLQRTKRQNVNRENKAKRRSYERPAELALSILL